MVVMGLWFSGNLKKNNEENPVNRSITTILLFFYPFCLELWDLIVRRITCSYVIDFSPSFLHMGMKDVGGAIFWIPAIVSELSCITKFESALWHFIYEVTNYTIYSLIVNQCPFGEHRFIAPPSPIWVSDERLNSLQRRLVYALLPSKSIRPPTCLKNPLKYLETITRHTTVYIGYYKVTTIW